jgi:hypothetical protein
MQLLRLLRTPIGWFATLGLVASLAACGGGDGEEARVANDQHGQPTASHALAVAETGRELAQGAALSAADLAQAELAAQTADSHGAPTADPLVELELDQGQIAPKSAYDSGQVARKAEAVRIPAYRFYNTSTAAHFYTTSETERAHVVTHLSPPFSFDGPAFSVASAYSPGLSPVHRFYNTLNGVHFYTISEAERTLVAANPQFRYEGVAYHASQVAGTGFTPLYRFYVPGKGFHFYTASQTERDSIVANLAATYRYEGVGYQVLASDWRPQKLPHSGVRAHQCFRSGDGPLWDCSISSTSALNPQQDGHRAGVNTMGFSLVSYGSEGGLFSFVYPLTSCVKDNVTGLVWEGKTDDGGLRDKDNSFTHLGGGGASDASGYVVAVNASNLCGFSDWRLPTVQELQSVVDFGAANPSIRSTSFPNTLSLHHWSSEMTRFAAGQAWSVSFASGLTTDYHTRASAFPVRLVRGSAPIGARYTYSTAVYAGDADNNVVNDAWTGLQWRRCAAGQSWNGSTCTGGLNLYTHEGALVHARDQIGWRMPNVKELGSLLERNIRSGVYLDATAFPGANTLSAQWASTPDVGGAPSSAWVVGFNNGAVSTSYRGTLLAGVRLVRADP